MIFNNADLARRLTSSVNVNLIADTVITLRVLQREHCYLVVKYRSVKMAHRHGFDMRQWPFDLPVESPAYSTSNVVNNGYPILTIAHDHDGDWQFLCGAIKSADDMSIVCFGCMFEGYPWIAEFHDLPCGWIAWRESEEADWLREPIND